ncbi:MAG: glycosyltransferase [Candidatus Thorarchaeota archaeon]
MESKKIKNICMLSTHGYVDPEPQLGRTDTGGQVVYVLQLSKILAKQGMNVDIYTRWFDESSKRIENVFDENNLRIVRIPAGPSKFVPKEELYEYLPELADNMIEFIRKNELSYDLYHAHYVDAGIVAVNVAKAFDKPVFFTAHSLGAWKRELMDGHSEEMDKKYKFRHRIEEEKKVFYAVNGQTATTTAQIQVMKNLYGFQSENTVIIPPGVDIEAFHPEDAPVDSELPTNYIFCLSRIDENKGHEVLLNAFDLVRRKVPDIHLVIGGGSPNPKPREVNLVNKIKRIIEERDMQHLVHVIGFVPDEKMRPLYKHARLFVLPSTFEPFGMTALEAMACQTPTIVSKFAGIAEFLQNRKDCVITDSSNQEEFSTTLIELLENRKLAEQIGKSGLDLVHESYSWEAIAARHMEFYRNFMNRSSDSK